MNKYKKKNNVIILSQFDTDFTFEIASKNDKNRINNTYSRLKNKILFSDFHKLLISLICFIESQILLPRIMGVEGSKDTMKDDLDKYGSGLFECIRRLQIVKAGDLIFLNKDMEEKGIGWFVYQEGLFKKTSHFVDKLLPVEAAFQIINSELKLDGYKIAGEGDIKFEVEDCNDKKMIVPQITLGKECQRIYLITRSGREVVQKMDCCCC
jgi:hypothetical protein